ncbi:protein-glutamine gamma-glutamyltransferase K-like isoform X1 [Branchiostoma floridae]|uniref:protein-glutamine gamma-glutamyltransferase n=1 Tax=Branchiostoma floridae TaxID=7739 RepID=A0A9J7MTX8_BRAFL|nr:protein-glutamine gamma-glutamyltransferase K-like isoform X1 [Branchiostoma floridae]
MSIRMPDGTPVVLNSGTESGGDDEMAGRATRAAGRHAPGGGTNSASDRSSRYNRLSELMKGKREAATAHQAQGPGYNRGTYTSHTTTNNSYQPGSFMAGGAQGGYMAGSTGFSSGYRSAPSGGGFGGYTGAAGGRFRAADVFPSVFGGTGAAGGSGSTYPRAGMGGGFGGGHHSGGLGGGHAGFAPPSAAGFQGGFSGGGGFGLNDFSSTTDGLFDPHRPQNFGPGGIRMGDPLDFDDLDPLTPVTPDIPTPSFPDHLRRQPASFTETTRTSYFDRFKTSESSSPKESVTQNGEDHLFISKAYIELERGGRKNLNPMVIQEPPSEDDGPLKLTNIDFLNDENGRAHHTDEFEEHNVVRRGQPFTVELRFEKTYDEGEDKLKVELHFGDNPLPNKGTLLRMPVGKSLEDGKFSAALDSSEGGYAKVKITTPPDAIVGKYHVVIETMSDGKTFRSRKTDDNTVVVLFNPWVKDDMTYLDDDAQLGEYVLNEHGYQYYGTSRRIGKRPWNFGQFEPKILDVCLRLLDRSQIKAESRGDAVKVSRIVSKMVNSADDGGVLTGNWSGNYAGGRSPTAWNGSVEILRQYYERNRPVCYGQCWVFSGVMTTVLRCLGIPARSVTNYDSAHDTDVSMTIDNYMDHNLREIDGGDSVWNFHVWNEAWMARPDLPEGYGGWQAVDATPQETSDGVYCCGPCPISAVKNGHVYLPYDTKFVFAEVNADKVYWLVDRHKNLRKLRTRKAAIGNKMSTKAVGSNARHDLTENYKYPEGSDQERVAVRTAVSHGLKPNTYDDVIEDEDVEFDVHADDEIYIGQNIHVTLSMKNTSSEPRKVTTHLTARAMYYTGVPAHDIGELEKDVFIPPNGEASVEMTFTPREYLDMLVDQAIVKIHAMAHVDDTNQVYSGQDDFRLMSPDLTVKAPTKMTLGEQVTAEIEFTNPLDVTLSMVEFHIEGPGLQKPKKISHTPIKPGETVKVTERMTPRKVGKKTIMASFTSNKLTQVTGELDVVVS